MGSVISKKSKCSTLCFYATIEPLYGGNRFAVVVREWNMNFFMAPTVYVLAFSPVCVRFLFHKSVKVG